MRTVPALAVLLASASVEAALEQLDGYDEAARVVLRRRVEGFDLFYLAEVGGLRRRLAGAAADARLDGVVAWAELRRVEGVQEGAPPPPEGDLPRVVLRGSRVVGVAEAGREEEAEEAGALDEFESPLGPPPDLLRERGFRSAYRAAEEGRRAHMVPVYFATDRAQEEDVEGRLDFGAARGELRFGVAEVSLPHDHRRGEIERPSWWRRGEDPERHVMVVSVELLGRDRFVADAGREVGRSDDREALLFVHGYNTSFPAALRRTAQLAHDLMPPAAAAGRRRSYEALPILFSWPSYGGEKFDVLAYPADETNARWAVDHFEQVLEMALTELGGKTVHVVAHSMGNRVLVEALRTFDPERLGAGAARLREVVLAAPDLDADTFRAFARRYHRRAGNFTLYASSYDKALAASRKLRRGLPRAGETGEDLVVVEGVQTIDASGVMRDDFLAHSYFAGKTVLSDLFYLLKHDHEPDQRDGLRGREREGLPYWEFVQG